MPDKTEGILMLEVCFGDSEKGMLACAQHCGSSNGGGARVVSLGQRGGGNPFVWVKARREKEAEIERQRQEQQQLEAQAIPLGGTKQDLVGLSFALDMGDIAAPLTAGDCPRRQLIYRWLTADPWGEQQEMQAEAEQFWQACLVDLETLKARAARGETVRIWVDATPGAACGLRFTAALLEGIECPITVVNLPLRVERPDGTSVSYRGWGEVLPEQAGALLSGAQLLSAQQCAALAAQWKTLQRENASLRAVQGERVISVGEDYYDDRIRAEYPVGTCRVAELIGRVLSKQNPGVGDNFLAQRIRVLLQQGELMLVRDDPKRFYNTIISGV
ncbi:MAG: DUF3658 domain-containing protein, partial [Pygmaiobacter sp.]